MAISVALAISTFSLISVERALDRSRFSMSVMFSRMSPSAVARRCSRSASSSFRVILYWFCS